MIANRIVGIIFWLVFPCAVNAQDEEGNSEFYWTQVEVNRTKTLLFRLASGSLYLSHELALTEEQMNELALTIKLSDAEGSKLEKQNGDLRFELMTFMAEGNEKEEKKAQFKLDKARYDISKKYVDKMLNETLIPLQAERIKQIAKQIRLIEQAETGDEFAIPYIVAKDADFSGRELKAIKNTMESIREEYYRELIKLQNGLHIDVLDSLPSSAKLEFEKMFGEPYNYSNELMEKTVDGKTKNNVPRMFRR